MLDMMNTTLSEMAMQDRLHSAPCKL